jgi:cytidylate kinase
MAVWTIAAEEGTGGARIAASLAAASDAALLDRSSLVLFARELSPDIGDARGLEERVGGRLNLSALSIAMSTGSDVAFRELQMMRALPELGRTIMRRAAQTRCVILASAGFAALPDHPSAIHVRVRAPLQWRIDAYQRENVVDRRCAEKAVKHDDHVKHAWVRTLYGLDIDDARNFALTIDASRVSPERIVDLLLAAAGISAETATPAGWAESGTPA